MQRVSPTADPALLEQSTASAAIPSTAVIPVQPAPVAEASRPSAKEPAAVQAAHGPSSSQTHEPAAAASAAKTPLDQFAEAARLFSFTGQTPVRGKTAEPVASPAQDEAEVSAAGKKHKAPRRRRGGRTSVKRMAAASLSFGAIVAVGLLAVGMTTPAEAVASADTQLVGAAPIQQPGDVSASGDGEIQAYIAPGDSQPTADSLDRTANYSTARLVEMAGTTGISNVSSAVFTNNPQCDVQWPFAVGVPISYGFGPRPGEFHEGVDFTPGYGAHVQAIADGVVRVAQQGYQGYGVAVIIDHEIDGQHWASLYGHMEYGSLQVHAGEHVKVGQYIGRTGNTGFSFGAHTHVEIRQNGVTPIDPLPWLRAHNRC